MLVGGALAGLAGMVELSGVEARLRPEMLVGYGYIAFLASWLARHDPLKAMVSSLALAAIAVGGFGLKISAGLSGAAVNVLMALDPARRARVRPEEGSLMLEAVLTGAVAGGTSILFPVVGETFAERSGVINLGTEGSMLAGALTAYIVGIESGSVWLGAFAGAVAGALLALVHAFMVLTRGANQIASGLVVTFLGIGLTALFGQDYVGQGVNAFAAVPIPVLSDIPFFGPILFDHDPLTYLAILSGPLGLAGCSTAPGSG